jgi:hypothetical protein
LICGGSPDVETCLAQCRQNNQESERQRQQSTPVFGAIAVTRDGRHYGYSHNWNSQYAAEENALRYCRSDAGNTDACTIAVWFYDGCGAFARDDKGAWGADWGGSPREAGTKAMRICQNGGGQGCKVVRSVCSP